MIQKRISEELEKIALEYDLPIYVIEEIFNSQFKVVKRSMQSLTFPTIKLPNWGKYIASKVKLSVIDYESKRLRIAEYARNKNNISNTLDRTQSGDLHREEDKGNP